MSTKIDNKTTIADLGGIICEALRQVGIDAFLSGGAVVSIYTQNKYESFDLDFVTFADRKKLKEVMESLGFQQKATRHFTHPKTAYFVEFPGSAVFIGDQPVTEFSDIKTSAGTLKLLTPTDCVKDRLAAYFHWNDRQSLEQAVAVANAQPVKISEIKGWSEREGQSEKYVEFLNALRASKRP